MTISTFMLILRAALLCLSFAGLCASARVLLKLNRFIAPCFAACSIITVLMLGGMLRVLSVALALLYAAGLAGAVYVYLIKRAKPDLFMIGLFAVLTAYLVWRFWPCKIWYIDDLSHWALVARYMLRSDAFPDAGTTIITFQSYPLGAACFIYYIDRALNCGEGMWLAAQNLLLAITTLPLFACISKKNRWLAPVLPVLFLILFKSDRPMLMLVVDWLLCSFGIGMAAITVHERRNPAKAFLIALPCMISCIYLKSSGIFFAVLTVILQALYALHAKGRRTALKILIGGIAASFGFFLLWTLHVKLTFPAGLDSKHAVSLSAYAQQASGKSLSTVLAIAKGMLLAWLPPTEYQLFALGFLALCIIAVYTAAKACPALLLHRTQALKALAFCVLLYAVWYLMLFAMYLFSMPSGEARQLAALVRYDSTGVVYVIGLACIAMLHYLSLPAARFGKKASLTAAAMAVILLVAAPVMKLSYTDLTFHSFYGDLVIRDTEYQNHRVEPQTLLAAHDIPDEKGRYIICLNAAENIGLSGYASKYELLSADIAVMMRCTSEKYADAPYVYQTLQGALFFPDPITKIAEEIDQCDAILVYEEDPVFMAKLDEFMSGYTGDTPVYYAYR